jgi:hypothetical protein
MALIPGVSLQKGVTDAAGHLVVGLSANGAPTSCSWTR